MGGLPGFPPSAEACLKNRRNQRGSWRVWVLRRRNPRLQGREIVSFTIRWGRSCPVTGTLRDIEKATPGPGPHWTHADELLFSIAIRFLILIFLTTPTLSTPPFGVIFSAGGLLGVPEVASSAGG